MTAYYSGNTSLFFVSSSSFFQLSRPSLPLLLSHKVRIYFSLTTINWACVCITRVTGDLLATSYLVQGTRLDTGRVQHPYRSRSLPGGSHIMQSLNTYVQSIRLDTGRVQHSYPSRSLPCWLSDHTSPGDTVSISLQLGSIARSNLPNAIAQRLESLLCKTLPINTVSCQYP